MITNMSTMPNNIHHNPAYVQYEHHATFQLGTPLAQRSENFPKQK